MKLFLTLLAAANAAAASNIVQLAEATPAFSTLAAGVVSNLLKPENKATLDDVLTYHVVSGAVHAADLSDGQVIKTVEGKTLLATVNKTGVFINDAQVTTANVDASNGVVHIVDAVLLPAAKAPTPAPAPAGKTIVDLAVATPDLSTLVTAVKAGGLVDTLSGAGPFTVFAPTNEAFARLPKGTLDYLLKPENKAKLVDILTYHVASGAVKSTDLKNDEKITTVEGKQVEARIYGGGKYVYINNARVTTADVAASNGVVHIIDHVLLPPSVAQAVAAEQTIVDVAAATADLSTLVAAVKA